MTDSESSEIHSPSNTSTSAKLISSYRISGEPWYRKNLLKWASYDLGNTIIN